MENDFPQRLSNLSSSPCSASLEFQESQAQDLDEIDF